MYVPAFERSKIALVCKKWKRVLDDYSWFDVKKLELTHWELDKYPNFLKKNYPTIDGQFSFLKSLINKCGRYLIELDLTAYGHCNIVPVINESCPNLVKLRIRIEYMDDAMLDNAFTGLSKLKVLKIIFQYLIHHSTRKLVTLVNSLLNVADTLTELSLSNWSGCMEDNAEFLDEVTSVIPKLKVLERIQIGGINLPQRLIDYLISKRPDMIATYCDEICKKWKRVLDDYSWFDVKKLELTHWEFDKYPNFLKKNYPTIDGQFSFLKSLLNNCGRYLTELDLTAYNHSNIVPVINESCPNLVKLRIRLEFIDDAMLDNAFTGLSKLKVLKIIFQNLLYHGPRIPVTLVNSLLNVADTLTELSVSNWSGWMTDNCHFPEEFTSVISELKALKRVQIGGMRLSKRLINYLIPKRPGIATYNDESKYKENKLDEQLLEYVKELHIVKSQVIDDFLYNVANQMTRLRILTLGCDFITDAGIVAISKINHLRLLDCFGYNNNITDSSIELLKNIRLLFLPFSNRITDKSAIKVLENSPDMSKIRVRNTGVTSEFIKKADEISRNRKKKLTVGISCEDGTPYTQIYKYLTFY
ncbi:uncharacterized protein LOC122850706 [Aphidius gifuensis]|uniref:uncharacterized protein LOC122850706 n=1 Tax=Aphidius gifuensis TaxID=684658 RepID=UPI001CDC16BF|nr:uncharacterized protein LOC122850706 [Aphidius gifuensis]